MNFDWISTLIGFMLGTATGASGKYLADKYTDKRKKKEYQKLQKQKFMNIRKQMPELITEFKNDLSSKEYKFVREFFVLRNKKLGRPYSQKPRFVYYEEEHNNLKCKMDLLENQCFLINVTTGNTLIYRMTEEFVELLIKYG